VLLLTGLPAPLAALNSVSCLLLSSVRLFDLFAKPQVFLPAWSDKEMGVHVSTVVPLQRSDSVATWVVDEA
jgi:hypothetical protein